MSESNFVDLAAEELVEVSGGRHHHRHCAGGFCGTAAVATAPAAGYTLSTVPGTAVDSFSASVRLRGGRGGRVGGGHAGGGKHR